MYFDWSDQSSSSATASFPENTIHQVATTSKESSELHIPPDETASSSAGHRTGQYDASSCWQMLSGFNWTMLFGSSASYEYDLNAKVMETRRTEYDNRS